MDFHKKGEEKSDAYFFSDVFIQKDKGKIDLKFTFYREISEILNGRENKGFGKAPLVVDFPKIDDVLMKETATNGIRIYSAEIENKPKEHFISFMRKDGLYKAKFRFDPNESQTTIRLEFRK